MLDVRYLLGRLVTGVAEASEIRASSGAASMDFTHDDIRAMRSRAYCPGRKFALSELSEKLKQIDGERGLEYKMCLI